MRPIINVAIIFLFSFSLLYATKENTAFEAEVYGEGPSMFLIPGATCSGEVWGETVEKYKDKYQIHVFTLEGYGGGAPLKSGEILPTIKDSLKNYIQKHESDNSILIGLTESKKLDLYKDQYKLWEGCSIKLIGNARHLFMKILTPF